MALETDTDQFKIGDGVTAWNALPYGGIQGPTGPTGPAASNAVQVYSGTSNSLVMISINDGGNVYIGSAFFCQITDSTNYAASTYGYLVTAGHVITNPSNNQLATQIWIHTINPTLQSFQLNGTNAVVMGLDKIADVALIRINSSAYTALHLPVKDSRTQLSIGEYVNVVGYPLGNDPQSITRGIVRDTKYQDENTPESVLTDASIYGGNSGGPVITDDQHVVGILSWGITGEENLNGAVASYFFKPILKYFCDTYAGSVVSYPKGYVGAYYTNVTFIIPMQYSGLKIEGVRITSNDVTITPAKFNQYDIVTEISGNRIGALNNQYPFFTEVHLRPPGTVLNMRYLPYNSGTNTYGAETSKAVTLEVFNPANDVFLRNVHRGPAMSNVTF